MTIKNRVRVGEVCEGNYGICIRLDTMFISVTMKRGLSVLRKGE